MGEAPSLTAAPPDVPTARIYLLLFTRGLVQVALVALNIRLIAQGEYAGVFVVGWLISWVWWSNSSRYRPDVPWAGATYAFGAATGNVLGMGLEHLLRWFLS